MAASSPAKFLFGFLLVSIILWLLFVFASRLVAWLLSRIVGASVTFRVGGWKCLRDIVVKFKKGPIDTICVGEIKVSLRQSLVKLGAGFFSRDPKLQVLISELEIVMRPSSTSKEKSKSRRTRNSGKGKGKVMVVANMARFLSVSITDLAVKTPKATVEIKDLNVDLSKDVASKSNLSLKLHVLPIIIHLGDPQVSGEHPSSFGNEGCFYPSQTSYVSMERSTAPFSCEEFLVSCEFGHDREAGVSVKNLDISIGEVTANLNDALLSKSRTSTDASSEIEIVPAVDSATSSKKQNKNQAAVTPLAKYTSMIPEKVSCSLPKLDVNFVQREHNLFIENTIMGIQLRCVKSRSSEDVGESTRLDIQIDFSEIHLLRESTTSIIEILKLDVVSLVYIPVEPTLPVRAEVDVKLGGTQFNLLMSRLKPWLHLQLSKKKKKMVLHEGTAVSERSTSSEPKLIMWTCTVSAPEMTLVLNSINDLPLYRGCSQSLHIFANNISNTGTAVHLELGELNLYMEDEYQDCLKENLFGVEANSGSLMHVAKVSLDWGKKDVEGMEEDVSKSKLALSVDVTGVGISFTFKRVELLISTALSFQALLKNLSTSRKKAVQIHGSRASSSGKGTRLLKFNLERCSIILCGEAGLESSSVADPKRVNYGSQGGKMAINVSADGSPRTGSIMSTVSEQYKKLKYSVSFDIFHLTVCVNKEKQSAQMELERARSVYEDFLTEHKSGEKVTSFDMQNAKFVRRAGGHKEISLCSLFSAADITVTWEPDLHLSLVELGLHLKSLIQKKKLEQLSDMNLQDVPTVANVDQGKEMTKDSGQNSKNKKKESIFAVDIETLTISAEAGDGVEALVQIQSIFSENAQIGVLLEGLVLSFNGIRVLKSSRMQVSRIPRSSTSSADAKLPGITTWDWTLQGLDIHVSMPYRLQLRAIDDAVEDMLRAVKLITASKTKLFFPSMNESAKPKKPSSMKLGCIKICVRKLTADIEEEPMQGWLDEHYQLLKNEACELAVRLKYFDDILKGNQHTGSTNANDCTSQKKFSYDGLGVDFQDPSSIGKIQEELHRQSFRSYYQACQNLRPSEGSGACKTGFQAGFRPSASRTSLLSISVSELDLTLTSIKGGDDGMIKLLGKLDPISHEYSIPFSRLYGSNILLRTSYLAVQLRDYTYPLFSATSGKCEGCVILAQQATYFQPQVYQDVYVGKWRKVQLLRSASGTTPPLKTYLDLPIHFQKGEISFGVGYEPSFADIGYAFTVALRRANLSVRNPDPNWTSPPKKEKSLPWWDDMRQYMHGNISLLFNETRWYILATTDPYEKLDKLQFVSSHMEILQSDGRVYLSAKDFKIFISSLESLGKNRSLKLPMGVCDAFLETPEFVLEVLIDWDCVSGTPLNHYLFAFPNEEKTREIVLDPYRSTSLSLRWNILAKPVTTSSVGDVGVSDTLFDSHNYEDFWHFTPIFSVGAHDLAWITKFWMLNYAPPHKLRSFSRFPRFGVPRFPRSGNLSLDRVLTEFMLRIDVTPACVKHVALFDDDPAKGLTFRMTKLKYEMYQSRGKQKFTFDCKREPLDMVYRGFDIHMLKAFLAKASENQSIMSRIGQTSRKPSQSALVDRVLSEKGKFLSSCTEKNRDDGFLLSSDYFTIRKQAPKADPARLLAWQEAGRKNVEMTYVRSEFENGSESDEHARSDQSDDDGYNVVIADNCQQVFVYGLKLLWTIENRDAVWSWVGGLAKAFESPKRSPSLLYAQRKLHQQNEGHGGDEVLQNDKATLTATNTSSSSPYMQNDKISVLAAIPGSSSPHVQNGKPKSAAANHYASSSTVQNDKSKAPAADTSSSSPLVSHAVSSGLISSPSHKFKMENAASIAVAKNSMDDPEEEGTRHFMVNVIEPQFNLHSDEANGRFLLAAVSGRVLARSFHSVLHVVLEMIEKALGAGDALGTRNAPATGDAPIRESLPEMTWKRMELSVMLEHVQAHVAPTDVDPGAGLQWLPKISRNSAKVKRTGALLERVFMPCNMYFQYTRHKGGTPALKMKPLKELAFNSHDITATMTSRQFQVMLDVLTNLLFARLPKPRRSSLTYPVDDDEDVEEEADEVVPYGVEEVELAKINLEKKEREQKLLIDDIRKLSHCYDAGDSYREEGDLWMIRGGKYALVKELKRELANIQKCRKDASSALRMALQKAAQQRLMEKEKNKSPSYAMRISLQITKVVWGMLIDGKPFAEAEINDLIYDFDRDYKDVGVALFTTKSIVVRNCLPNAKSDMLLSAWNPPHEWGKKLMLRVDAKQGAPKDGHSPLELFQVEIYPLKIHLTETMYRMMWEYLFPTEEQDSQRRQEVWKISTTAGSKRVKKGSTLPEASTSCGPSTKESEATARLPNNKTNIVSGLAPELRRTSSFDRSWEETVAESVANELVLQAHSSSRRGPLGSAEQADESAKKKDSRTVKSGRTSYEDKKVGKAIEEKRSRPRKLMEFHNIKISQVELCVTYEGSRFVVNDLKLLMDTFHRDEFIGTWRRLFSRVKKHIIWGVLKSVTGMQGKKFKDKGNSSKETIAAAVPDSELNFSDNEGGPVIEKNDQFPIAFTKRKEDVAGDGFVTSIRGLFNTQRRRAKKFVLRTMRGEENDYEWSESDAEFSPFARQLTITKAKKLIRRHTKKFRNKGTKGSFSQQKEDLPASPMDPGFESDSSGGGSSPFEDFHEELTNAN